METVFTKDMAETTNSTDREVTMSKFFVSCPCGCDEAVEATDAGFAATTVKVAACSKWAANGITSSVMRKSWAYASAIAETTVQHRDGLVVFA